MVNVSPRKKRSTSSHHPHPSPNSQEPPKLPCSTYTIPPVTFIYHSACNTRSVILHAKVGRPVPPAFLSDPTIPGFLGQEVCRLLSVRGAIVVDQGHRLHKSERHPQKKRRIRGPGGWWWVDSLIRLRLRLTCWSTNKPTRVPGGHLLDRQAAIVGQDVFLSSGLVSG